MGLRLWRTMQVKAGICCAHLESDIVSSHGMHEAQQYFGNLLEEPLADNADLCLTVADELLQLEHAEEVWKNVLVHAVSDMHVQKATFTHALLHVLQQPMS